MLLSMETAPALPVSRSPAVSAAAGLWPAAALLAWLWSPQVRPPDFTFAESLAVLVAVAAGVNDALTGRIPNRLTYPVALWALTLPVVTWFRDDGAVVTALGLGGALGGLTGLLIAVVIVRAFTGGGAGDAKLAATLGALLGFERGLLAVLVAYVVAGTACLLVFAVEAGPRSVAVWALRRAGSVVAPGTITPVSAERLPVLARTVPLGPCFAVGVMAVVLARLGRG
jgi:Flp pilus assembly protein protease CpaA